MAKKAGPPVPKEVHQFLSQNGKKGGLTTKRLVELGREAARERGEQVGMTEPPEKKRRAKSVSA